jgi:hypothetical protein
MGALSANLIGFLYFKTNSDYNGEDENYDINTVAYRWVFGLPLIFCLFRLLGLILFFKSDPPGYYVSKNK